MFGYLKWNLAVEKLCVAVGRLSGGECTDTDFFVFCGELKRESFDDGCFWLVVMSVLLRLVTLEKVAALVSTFGFRHNWFWFWFMRGICDIGS